MTGCGGPGDGISCVMPAYNEEGNIRESVEKIAGAVKKAADDFEIIVVDDGSDDGTAGELESAAGSVPQLKVIRHERNMGYGAALRSGFSAAKMPLLFYTDSDNQFDPSEIGLLLPLIGEYDIVTGYRKERKDPPERLLASALFNAVAGRILGIEARDINCAFKLYRREVFDVVKIELDNFFVDAEILAKAAAAGFRTGEVAVSHYPRSKGKSTVGGGDLAGAISNLLKIRKSAAKMKTAKQ